MNPTQDAVEQRIAALEGGVAALLVSSGSAATTFAILNLAEAGDHIVSSPSLYGGTYNLFHYTLPKFGIDATFIEDPDNLDEWRNAIRPNTKISKITLEEWDLVFNTNLKAPFFLSQAVLPGMIERKWGRIINIGGTDAYWGKVRRAHGVSAKLGLVGLTRAMPLEVARFGVTINVVIPGTIDTQRPHPEWYPELKTGYAERLERIPMARLGDTQQVANACLFLASDLASFTTAQELFASGGAVPLVRQTLDEYGADEF